MKDTHTEHCCVHHGCKYGADSCTVVNGELEQSYPCERCKEYDYLKKESERAPIMHDIVNITGTVVHVYDNGTYAVELSDGYVIVGEKAFKA